MILNFKILLMLCWYWYNKKDNCTIRPFGL